MKITIWIIPLKVLMLADSALAILFFPVTLMMGFPTLWILTCFVFPYFAALGGTALFTQRWIKQVKNNENPNIAMAIFLVACWGFLIFAALAYLGAVAYWFWAKSRGLI